MSPHNCEPFDLNGTRQNRGRHECFEESDKRKNIYKDGWVKENELSRIPPMGEELLPKD